MQQRRGEREQSNEKEKVETLAKTGMMKKKLRVKQRERERDRERVSAMM